MSNQVTTAFVKQFGTNVQLLSQQRGSVLRGLVRNETIKGEEAFYEQVGVTAATKKTVRHGDTPLMDTPFARRRVTVEDYEWADLFDKEDQIRMLIDPMAPAAQTAGYAFGRAMDAEIIRAADAVAFTGKTGTTTTAYSTAMDVAVTVGGGGAVGLNVKKLIEAKFLLDSNNVDPSLERYIVCNARQMANLLNETEVKSRDYNSVQALVRGEISEFMGFKFVRTELIGKDASNYDKVLFFVKDGLLLASGADVRVRVTERADKSYAQQVYLSMSIGATRMEEVKVGRILCA